MRTFSLCLLSCLWSWPSFAAKYELGWVIDNPWALTALRAKTKAAPKFVLMNAGGVEFDGTVNLKEPFANMTNVCSRNADVEFRFAMKVKKIDVLAPKMHAALRASFSEKLMGLCPSAVEFGPYPIAKKHPSVWLPWAKAFKALMHGDFPVKMLTLPIGTADTTVPHITKEIANGMVAELDGVNILFSDLGLPKDAYRPLLTSNLTWANERATATGKVITFIVSGVSNNSGKPTAPDELPAETLEVVKAFKPKSLPAFCTGQLRFAVASDRATESRQDRAFAEIEKWVLAQCGD